MSTVSGETTTAAPSDTMDNAPAPVESTTTNQEDTNMSDANALQPETATTTTEKAQQSKPTRNKIMFDPSLLPESSDPAVMRKQVEFYFCDSNLRFDKFLWSMVTKENKWVPIQLVSSFKRMQRFKDLEAIKAALESSELLELSETKAQLRRKVPLKIPADLNELKQVKAEIQERTVYAKGFGEETPLTQYHVEQYFEPHGATTVRLRREDDNTFKGSVFAEFATKAQADAFLALENKPKYLDTTELTFMSKTAYVEMKINDIKEGRIQPANKKRIAHFDAFYEGKSYNTNARREEKNNQRGGRGGHNGQRGGRGGRGGQRGGRGGRGGQRGGHGGQRNNERKDSKAEGPETTASGIPKVLATNSAAPVEQPAKAEQGTKRPLENGGEAGGSSEKKVKVD